MKIPSRASVLRQAELQIQVLILVMVGPVVTFAAWNRGLPQLFWQPQFYLIMAAGLVAAVDLASLMRRRRLATPPPLLPALLVLTALSSVAHTGPPAVPWVFAGILVLCIRVQPRTAALWGVLTVAATVAVLATHPEGTPRQVVRALLLCVLLLGLTLIFLHASRRITAALDDTRQMLQTSIDAMSQGLSVIGPDGRVLLYNQCLCKMLDLPEELLARYPMMDEVVAYQHAQGHFGKGNVLVAAEGRTYVDSLGRDLRRSPPRYLRRTHDGRTLEVLTQKLPDGTLVRTFADVTQYDAAQRAAVQAGEAKTQFLANMSHELRTPMSSMLGLMRLLQGTPLDAQQKDYLRKMDRAGRSLLDLLNDILDLSKIEAGKMTLANDKLVIGEFLRDIRMVAETLRSDRELDLRFEIGAGVPKEVLADPQRLRQVMLNLVGNAIKFTHRGHVLVRIDREAAWEGEVTLRWSVIDTGIGIAPEQQQRIFESFTQADASISRSYGGTGLGLSITTRLLALMNSRLELQSELGAGSHFRFDIVLRVQDDAPSAWPAERPVSQPTPGDRLTGLRVLVVEDEPINRMVAQQLLEREGCLVRTAANGRLAVDALAASSTGFDCVLMDLQMPELDGLSATRQLRQMPGLETLPIYAMTANVLDAERQACLDAGMTGHVGKPFDLEIVVALLRQHAPSQRDATAEL